MDNVRLSVQVDFGVGDAVSPGPRLIEYPVLLDSAAAPMLRAYPVESAVAEKFQAMVQLDVANSRLKDFYDIWVCSRHLEFHGPTLAKSFTATFERRKTAIPAEPPVALTRAYFGDGARGQQWDAFANRIGERRLVGRFAAVVAELKEFLMPPSVAAARKELFPMYWRAEGPWREKSGP